MRKAYFVARWRSLTFEIEMEEENGKTKLKTPQGDSILNMTIEECIERLLEAGYELTLVADPDAS